MDYLKSYKKWVNYSKLDFGLKKELDEIVDNPAQIEDSFYKDLEFGTGGLRGIIGAGTNRINIYTVRKATQGLANYIKKTNGGSKVVIAYDSRYKSKEFAEQAALVLAKNNIAAYVFNELTPTPILSYAVREIQAVAGIVITASHNPKEYNGYKVYWSDGGQITDNIANAITREINIIADELLVEILDKEFAKGKGLFRWLDDGILNAYVAKTKELVLRQDIIKEEADKIKIVYTALHGTGNTPVTRVLQEVGFNNVVVVPEQCEPDCDFSTVKCPNPEEHAAFELAINLANEIKADIVMGTDPDADRVGVAVRDPGGKYLMLTGNQLGALMIDYILQMKKHNNSIPANGVVVKTIVTSSMGVNIAQKYGVGYIDVLTGFKYIGEKIKEFEEKNSYAFLFGYEESYGYLIGDYVRDKDAVQACLVVAEMAAYYKSRGISLLDRLNQLFEEFGYYQEDLVSFNLKGIAGQERIKRILDTLRAESPKIIASKKVNVISDYLHESMLSLVSGEMKSTKLPKANVLHFTLEDGSWFCIRPSGTEPKLKIYFNIVGESRDEADQKLSNLKASVLAIIDQIS
ncbi:MAG: phosphoglucomutase [Clostridiaceae bacterium BRH_c20a]|nr:MAG: phosphoglucomutase [Clostridiaceae bacterium BRH_c20a]